MVSKNINIFGSNAALHAGQSIKVRCLHRETTRLYAFHYFYEFRSLLPIGLYYRIIVGPIQK